MKCKSWFAVFALIGCSTLPKQDTPTGAALMRAPSSASYPITIPPAEDDLSFRKLKDILEKNQFNSIDSLLAYLANDKNSPNFKNYLSNYTLAHSSLSLHESSYEYPRAIVYGRRGNFFITFNGKPEQRGFEFLEVAEFNQQKKEFEYREIEFNEQNISGKKPFSISEIGGPRSRAFPEGKCMSCHSGSRPIWEPYFVWPGMYGSDDDYPIRYPTNRSGYDSSRTFDAPIPPMVAKRYQNFVDSMSGKDRYKFLGPLSNERELVRYSYEVQSPFPDYMKNRGFSKPLPNLAMTIAIYSHNIERIVRRIEKLRISSAQAIPLYVLLNYGYKSCGRNSMISFLNNDLLTRMNRLQDAKENHRNFLRQKLAEENDMISNYQKAPLPYRAHSDYEAAFYAALEKMFPDAGAENWSPALYPGVYNFSHPNLGGRLNEEISKFLESRIDYTELERIKKSIDNGCDEYIQKQLQAL